MHSDNFDDKGETFDHTVYAGSPPFPIKQGFHGLLVNFYEQPQNDPDQLEVWCYTDRFSYKAGDEINFHVTTTARSYALEIVRDGASRVTVYREEGLPGQYYETPQDASVEGCGWPIAHSLRIPNDWQSGGYIVHLYVENDTGEQRRHESFFCLRAAEPGKHAKIVCILPTSTWVAYNNWGGSNHYEGITGPNGNMFGTHLSTQRPWHRGCIVLPNYAPRPGVNLPDAKEPGWAFWFPDYAYAFMGGYAKYATAAGWATFDRHFAVWAEENGYVVEYLTQHDVHFHPELLHQYKCAVIVGHDEYWTWEMRDAVDDFVDSGGNLARFAGNFLWQVRLVDDGRAQVCFKQFAQELDPVVRDDKTKHLKADVWESFDVERPGHQTVGLSGIRGIFSLTGGYAPRASGGFTVYRPDHWALAGSDLYYGDVFGSEHQISGFEVDGLTYTFRHGLPYPTYEDGALDDTEIIALTPAALKVELHGQEGVVTEGGQGEMDQCLAMTYSLYGEMDEQKAQQFRYGCGAVVTTGRGKGKIFCAGATQWVHGLRAKDPYVTQITKNVLDRFA